MITPAVWCRKFGFLDRTPKRSEVSWKCFGEWDLVTVRPVRLELTTCRLEGGCSIQLSYECVEGILSGLPPGRKAFTPPIADSVLRDR